MDARQYAASTTQLRRHCDKLLDAGYHCAFVHALPNGALKYYGSPVVTDVIQANSKSIKIDERWSEVPLKMFQEGCEIPDLSIPIEKMSMLKLRALIPSLIKSEKGRKQIGWGKEEKKPKWWPEHVPFENVNKKPVCFEGDWMAALRSIANAYLQHYSRSQSSPSIIRPSNHSDIQEEDVTNNSIIKMDSVSQEIPVPSIMTVPRLHKRKRITYSYSDSADDSDDPCTNTKWKG